MELHTICMNSLSSAGQMIPFAIGIAAISRLVYVYLFKEPDDQPSRPHSPIDSTRIPLGYAAPPQPGRV